MPFHFSLSARTAILSRRLELFDTVIALFQAIPLTVLTTERVHVSCLCLTTPMKDVGQGCRFQTDRLLYLLHRIHQLNTCLAYKDSNKTLLLIAK